MKSIINTEVHSALLLPHTHPFVLINPLEGLLRQRVVHVSQLSHHGTQQLDYTHNRLHIR